MRVVKANGLDLSLFQFDYDLTFAAVMMNKDKTVYSRYGTRSDQKDSMRHISLDGLRKSLEAALELHQGYPANKASLAGKAPRAPRFPVPEQYPSLKSKALVGGLQDPKVRQNCLHCHQLHDAERNFLRAAKQPVPDEKLYLFPLPDWLGLSLDPDESATVKAVAAGSQAEKDGFKSGDRILTLDGQPLTSIADAQWALHHAKAPGKLKAQVSRGGTKQDLSLTLEAGWRLKGAFNWRTSTWSIRQWAGGMLSEDADPAVRKQLGLDDRALALQVKHVGQYAPHNIAQKAGLKKDDVIVEFDGLKSRLTEGELLAHIAQKKKPGDAIALSVLRGGQPQKLQWVLPPPKE